MTDSVLEWLKSHGLERYAPTFIENEVDLRTLSILSDADLNELGLPFGPRKRILRALETETQAAQGVAGERRQVTALFCDIVGFTELSQRVDPEDLQLIARRYEEACAACITRYEGHVYQRLGDGIVAIFGYPSTHEGEAERAIRAGLEIIEKMPGLDLPEAETLRVRIGIASGIVVVASGDQNLVGDTMNLAARLEAAAEPGSILVSSPVRQLTRGSFDFEDRGTLTLKGITEPTRAYRVIGPSRAETRFDAASEMRLTPMVGRDPEIGLLLDLWTSVEKSRTGQAATLSGEPGIGKSRLLNALSGELSDRGVRSIYLQCSPFHTNSAYHPIKVYLERMLSFDRGLSLEARLARVERFVVAESGQAREDVRFLAAILSLPYQDAYGPITVAPKQAKAETIRVLVNLLAAQARAHPSLVFFEDLHWADPSTLQVLEALFERLAEIPIMVLATHRLEFRSNWTRFDRVSSITLHRLSQAQSSSLVSRIAGGRALPGSLTHQIADRADGVPLFVEELTKAILESGQLEADGDSFVQTDTSVPVSVPGTLRDLLMARLDQSPAARRVAQIGAIIGRDFSYELIAALEVMREPELSEALSKLAALELAYRRGTGPKAIYTFKHALVQDAARDSLLKRERKEIHARLAAVLEEKWPETRESEPEVLAHHYTEAGMTEQAVRYWQQAGAAAVRRFALPEAIAYLRKGMEQVAALPPSADRDRLELGLRTQLGPVVVAQYGWGNSEIARVLEPAWTLAETLEHRQSYVPILNTLSIHYFSICDMPASLESARKLLDAGISAGEEDLEIVGNRAVSAAHFWMGNFAGALEHGDNVRRMYDPERHWHLAQTTNIDPFSGEGVYRGQYLWMMGYPDQARSASNEKDENARRRNHPFDLAFALTLGAQLFGYLHEPEELLRRTDEAERVARKHGLALMSEVMVQISRGVALLRAGQYHDSTAQLDDAITRFHSTGHRVWLSYLRALQAEATARAGDPRAAMSIVDASLAHYRKTSERAHHAEVLRIKGWLHLQLGETDLAERHLRAALDAARTQSAKSWELRSALTLARLQADRGELSAAHELVSEIYGWFTEGFETKDLMRAKAFLEDLGGGRPGGSGPAN